MKWAPWRSGIRSTEQFCLLAVIKVINSEFYRTAGIPNKRCGVFKWKENTFYLGNLGQTQEYNDGKINISCC